MVGRLRGTLDDHQIVVDLYARAIPLSAAEIIDTLRALARVLDALPADALRGASTPSGTSTPPSTSTASGNRRADWPDSWR